MSHTFSVIISIISQDQCLAYRFHIFRRSLFYKTLSIYSASAFVILLETGSHMLMRGKCKQISAYSDGFKHETALYKGLCQAIVTFSCQSTSEHHINLTSLFYSNSFFRILQLIIPESTWNLELSNVNQIKSTYCKVKNRDRKAENDISGL